MIEKDMFFKGILSKSIVKKYNYSKTKSNIDDIMLKIEEYSYRIHNIQPPRITPSYEIRYDSNKNISPNSKIENYVTKLLDIESEAEELYSTLNRALNKLCKNELCFFKGIYYEHTSQEEICNRLYLTMDQLKTIKISCILKLGMEFDVCVENR